MSFFEQIEQWDIDLLLYLNGLHSPFLDQLFWWISNKFIWIPLYLFLLYLLYRKYSWKGIAVIIPAIALLVLATDQGTNLFKNVLVERYRPTHNLLIGDLVHLVNDYKGGQHGFVSGHTSNSFALATFMFLLFDKAKPYRWLFFWAFIVGYSRIYLGVHYPLDVIGGAMLGIFTGVVFAKFAAFGIRRFAAP